MNKMMDTLQKLWVVECETVNTGILGIPNYWEVNQLQVPVTLNMLRMIGKVVKDSARILTYVDAV